MTIKVLVNMFHDYSQYNEGDVFDSTIISIDENSFFVIIDSEKNFAMKHNEPIIPLFWIPSVNEVFYLKSKEGFYLRAIRLESDEVDAISIYLLDTGETIKIDSSYINDMLQYFYTVPEDEKNYSGRAIKCVLAPNNALNMTLNNDEFVEQNLYKKFTLAITKVFHDKLQVELFPLEDSFGSTTDTSDECSDQEIFKFDEEEMNDKLTEDQVHDLFDDTQKITGNAQIAVQGFETSDEVGICPFYDESIKGCFKGGKCKFKHVGTLEGGICSDKDAAFSYHTFFGNSGTFFINATLQIKITDFKSVNIFVCQLVGQEASLINLIKEMQVNVYRKPKHDVCENELVVVKAKNGQFYRARVDEIFSFDERFAVTCAEVLLLDLGVYENVKIKDIFMWEAGFSSIHFHAFEMEIANIKAANDEMKSKEAIEMMLQESDLKAQIVDNTNGIKCYLLGKTNKDIGLDLVAKHFVDKREVAPTYKSQPFTFC